MMPPALGNVLSRNIQALMETRKAFEERRSREQRIADAITRFTGSMVFVYLHAVLFGGWIVLNLGTVPFVKPWDPYPFVMLAMIASVEAIFLSTFVLISQNRMAEVADRRADLDLQINLLAEHEVTKLIGAVDAIALKLGVEAPERAELAPLKHDVSPEAVMEKLEDASSGEGGSDDAQPGNPGTTPAAAR
jgi:uncharacterized membrane protein